MIKSTENEIKQYIRDMNEFLDEKETTSQNGEDNSEDEDVEASIIQEVLLNNAAASKEQEDREDQQFEDEEEAESPLINIGEPEIKNMLLESPPRAKAEQKVDLPDSPVQNARAGNAEPFKLEELRISAP